MAAACKRRWNACAGVAWRWGKATATQPLEQRISWMNGGANITPWHNGRYRGGQSWAEAQHDNSPTWQQPNMATAQHDNSPTQQLPNSSPMTVDELATSLHLGSPKVKPISSVSAPRAPCPIICPNHIMIKCICWNNCNLIQWFFFHQSSEKLINIDKVI